MFRHVGIKRGACFFSREGSALISTLGYFPGCSVYGCCLFLGHVAALAQRSKEWTGPAVLVASNHSDTPFRFGDSEHVSRIPQPGESVEHDLPKKVLGSSMSTSSPNSAKSN